MKKPEALAHLLEQIDRAIKDEPGDYVKLGLHYLFTMPGKRTRWRIRYVPNLAPDIDAIGKIFPTKTAAILALEGCPAADWSGLRIVKHKNKYLVERFNVDPETYRIHKLKRFAEQLKQSPAFKNWKKVPKL